MTLPAKFVERVLCDLGEAEGRALCAALDGVPPVSVRVNPVKAAPGALPALEIAGQVPWCRDGRYLAVRPSFTLDPDFHAGAYYVQEASSQFVGHLLEGVRTEGARILDLCAAPGGKTTLYASLAGPGGLVVANEIDRRRAAVLADNVRKWGTGNVAVTTCEPRMLGDFEAWRALKPGGTLVYSTCTFNRDEDEGALERMLAWAGDEVAESDEIAVEDAWGIVCGRVGVFRTFRFYPHRACGEGFFAAVARKSFDAGGRVRTPKARRTVFAAADRKTSAELARWVREPDRMCFAQVADTFYAWYAAQADAVRALSEALPVICSGVALGQVFKGTLKPDPALALFDGLNRGAVPVAELDEAEALRYLRKQEIAAAGLAEGVNLVCARGRALGFAKRIGARVNNMYPNSLRIIKQ